MEGLCATSLMIVQPQNQLTKSNFQRNASLQERHSRFKYVYISDELNLSFNILLKLFLFKSSKILFLVFISSILLSIYVYIL